MRDTIQRVAAGVITPALSMLFVLIGDALYQYDPQAFTLEWVSVLPAAILGAPFAVPAALLIRLRHLWRCVPLIALCAAVGIEVQRNISTALGDSSSPAQTLGPTLMFVWVFPAAFGVAAALLLKWKESLYLAALPLAAVLAPFLAIQGGVLARERAPALSAAHSWSVCMSACMFTRVAIPARMDKKYAHRLAPFWLPSGSNQRNASTLRAVCPRSLTESLRAQGPSVREL